MTASWFGSCHDDDRRRDVPQHERIQEAGIRVVVVRGDRQPPAIVGGDTLVPQDAGKTAAVLRVDAARDGFDLQRPMCESDGIDEAAAHGCQKLA